MLRLKASSNIRASPHVVMPQSICYLVKKNKVGREAIASLKGRAFKIKISKVSGSALATEIYTDPHNRLLRRQRRIYGIWCCAENAEYGAGAANAGYSVALQSFPLLLYPIFRAGKKKRLGAERRPAVNIRMYQELLHDNLLAVYDVKTVLSLCNATTAEVINNTVLLCRFDDFCIVDAVGECTSRNQTP